MKAQQGWKKLGLLMVICAMVSAFTAGSAFAESDTIKIGIITEMSGPFADFGRHITNGAKAYIKEHGDTVAGKKIVLIIKDTTGPAPDVSKRLAQELIVKDKVDFLAGFGLTPNAPTGAPEASKGT